MSQAQAGKKIPTSSDDERRKDLGKIHMAAISLGLIKGKDDDLYRTVLKNVCGVESAKDLDTPNRRKLLAYFRGQGWGKEKRNFPGRPNNMECPFKGPMLKKIEAMLAEAKRPWSYVDGIAKKMFGVNKIGWCHPDQLHKIVSAMVVDAKRHGRKLG